MRRIPTLVLLSLAAACGGGSAAPQPDGPVTMGVVTGNHQVVTAARDVALPQPVVAQVVRQPNGQVSLRILDALLPPKAYAQTGVVGIPNQVVCASAPDPKHALKAEVACANSDAQGRATFVFHNDSVAGTSKAQVAAALATGTKITDSVSATVMPSAPAELALLDYIVGGSVTVRSVAAGDSINLHRVIAYVRDQFANFVAPASSANVSPSGLPDTTSAFTPQFAVRDGTEPAAPLVPDATGWFVKPRTNPTGHSTVPYPTRLTVYVWVGSVRQQFFVDVK